MDEEQQQNNFIQRRKLLSGLLGVPDIATKTVRHGEAQNVKVNLPEGDLLQDELDFYIDNLADDFCQKDEQGDLLLPVQRDDESHPDSALIGDDDSDSEPKDEKDDDSGEDSEETKNQQGTGRWSKDEHERFLMAMRIYGKDWDAIETFVGSRDATHCRSHAQKFFTKLLKFTQKSTEQRERKGCKGYIEDAQIYLEILQRRIDKPIRRRRRQKMKERQAELDQMDLNRVDTVEDQVAVVKRRIAKGQDIFSIQKDATAVAKKQAFENKQLSPMLQGDIAEKAAREKEGAFLRWQQKNRGKKNPRKIQKRGSFISISSNNSEGIQLKPIQDGRMSEHSNGSMGPPLVSDFTTHLRNSGVARDTMSDHKSDMDSQNSGILNFRSQGGSMRNDSNKEDLRTRSKGAVPTPQNDAYMQSALPNAFQQAQIPQQNMFGGMPFGQLPNQAQPPNQQNLPSVSYMGMGGQPMPGIGMQPPQGLLPNHSMGGQQQPGQPVVYHINMYNTYNFNGPAQQQQLPQGFGFANNQPQQNAGGSLIGDLRGEIDLRQQMQQPLTDGLGSQNPFSQLQQPISGMQAQQLGQSNQPLVNEDMIQNAYMSRAHGQNTIYQRGSQRNLSDDRNLLQDQTVPATGRQDEAMSDNKSNGSLNIDSMLINRQ